MTYNPDELQQRSESQLLNDFSGPLPEQQKLLNLIYSIYRALSGGGGSVSWDDITDKPAVIAAGADSTEALAAIGAASSADILSARANILPRVVSVSSSISNESHLGQTVISTAAGAITITLADDLPENSSGWILQTGAGEVTIATESGTPTTSAGKAAVIAGAACAVQWVKLASGVYVFGALQDAA